MTGAAALPDAAARWTVADVVDFEHFAARAIDAPSVDADRAAAAVASEDRRVVFRAWLAQARTERAGPGATYDRARRLVRTLACVSGLLIGIALAGALLSKHETEPINAPLFFGATVGLQLAVLAFALVAGLLARAGVRIGATSDLVVAVIGFCARLVDRLPGERRATLRARWAALDLRSARLAPLVACDALVVTQLFAIAFNAGLLVAMLFVYLPFTDLRFGWQSSYSFTAAGIAAWVRIVATPWAWLSDALAPGLDAIARTQYARGQRAETLPLEAARAWWPFLVMSIAVYGFALRAVVALAAAFVLRRRLARLAFASADANLLWRRIKGALLVAEPDVDEPRSVDVARDSRARTADLLVVDRELASRAEAIHARVGTATRITTLDVDDDTQAGGVDASRVLVAVSASRDPIVAIAVFLRTLTSKADAVSVVLVDASSATDERLAIWRRFAAIERLPVAIEPLA